MQNTSLSLSKLWFLLRKQEKQLGLNKMSLTERDIFLYILFLQEKDKLIRLCIFRSPRHIYAQVIDRDGDKTLAAASTNEKEFKTMNIHLGNQKSAAKVGSLIAERAKASGITKVVFDRSGYRFHGRVKALADAAREAGLNF